MYSPQTPAAVMVSVPRPSPAIRSGTSSRRSPGRGRPDSASPAWSCSTRGSLPRPPCRSWPRPAGRPTGRARRTACSSCPPGCRSWPCSSTPRSLPPWPSFPPRVTAASSSQFTFFWIWNWSLHVSRLGQDHGLQADDIGVLRVEPADVWQAALERPGRRPVRPRSAGRAWPGKNCPRLQQFRVAFSQFHRSLPPSFCSPLRYLTPSSSDLRTFLTRGSSARIDAAGTSSEARARRRMDRCMTGSKRTTPTTGGQPCNSGTTVLLECREGAASRLAAGVDGEKETPAGGAAGEGNWRRLCPRGTRKPGESRAPRLVVAWASPPPPS